MEWVGGRSWLVITYQETGLLNLPATVKEGPPLMRRLSKPFETPTALPLLGGGWEAEQVVVAVG